MKKQTILRLFFTGEVLLFTWFYFCGTNGIFAVTKLKKESFIIEQQIETTTREIELLQTTICAWQSDSFYKEKEAREKLHMAESNSIVYLYGNKK